MSWFKKLFGVAKARSAPVDIAGAFFREIDQVAAKVDDPLEALRDDGRLSVVDWADDAETVLSNLEALLMDGNALSSEALAGVISAGEKAGEAGRGHSALATISALDEALMGGGDRLLWIDRGGDAYEIMRVPNAIWERWHDVGDLSFSILEATLRNQYPRERQLSVGPR